MSEEVKRYQVITCVGYSEARNEVVLDYDDYLYRITYTKNREVVIEYEEPTNLDNDESVSLPPSDMIEVMAVIKEMLGSYEDD